jgi:hypothetical protein
MNSIPAADSAAPVPSNRRCRSGGTGSLSRRLRTMMSATIAACSRNDARQLIAVVISPPTSGPAAAPIPPMPLITPNARARDSTSAKNIAARM